MSSDFPEPENSGPPKSGSGSGHNPFLDFEISKPVERSPERSPTETNQFALPKEEEESDGLSYLHPTSLAFELLSQVRSYLVPAAIGLFGAAKGDFVYIILSAVLFVPAVMRSVFRYFTLRYCIKDDHLVVTQGLIFRNARTIPVERIQNIDFVQNPLHRIFNVAEVKIETASGTKPEATLRVLSMAQMDTLRNAVFKNQAEVKNESLGEANAGENQSALNPGLGVSSTSAHGTNQNASLSSTESVGRSNVGTSIDGQANESETKTLLQIPLGWLIRAGLASNRGMVMIGVATGLYFQFGGDRRNLNFDWMRDMLPEGASIQSLTLGFIAASIGALILFRFFGVGWYILRFFGYKLVQRGDDLRISCGLFTKVSATIPRKRVQFISIHRNLIMKWMGYSSIRIETAGGAGAGDQSAAESVSKRWFIPIIPDADVPRILEVLRPGLSWDEGSLDFKQVAPRTGIRLCRLAVIQSILIGIGGLAIWRPWGFIAGIIAVPCLVLWALKKSKSMRYARNHNSIVYRSGVFTKKTSMTFFEKVQTLSIAQSPFDRRWKMSTLLVDTAAAGQAEHRINVRYLDEQFAIEELEVLRSKTSFEEPVFG